MANFSNLLSSQNWFGDKISQETIVKFIHDHFTVSWEYFFRFQIPYLVRHRTFFGDLETWNVWGSIAIVQMRELIEKSQSFLNCLLSILTPVQNQVLLLKVKSKATGVAMKRDE